MFFDDARQRKPAGKVQLRLAADNSASDEMETGGASRESEAVRRHRSARLRRQTAGPSLLDQIDAITEQQAEREREESEHAEDRWAELEALAEAAEIQRHRKLAKAAAAKQAFQKPFAERDGASDHPHEGRSYQKAEPNHDDGAPLIDPRFVFRSVRNWRALIAATTMLGGFAGLYVAVNTPHLYFSAATVVIDPRNYKVIENDLNPDVFLSEAALAIVDSQVSLMRSPRVLEKVAIKLKLAKDEEFNGTNANGIGSFMTLLSSEKVDDFQGSALRYLSEHMSAERSPKTFVVNVGAYSQNPEKAALIANTIVDVYLEEQASTRSDTAKRTSGELGSRLDNLKDQVEKAERKVEAFKSENNLAGAQGRLIEDEEMLRVNDQLSAARSTTITLNSRAESAKSATVEAVAQGGLPEEVASTALIALRSQFVAAKQRHDGLAAKLGPMHPDLKQASNEMDSLRGAISGEIGRIRAAIQTDLKRAVETEQSLAKRLAQLKARQGGSGDAQVQLRELEREAASARTVYEQYLLRARETGEQGNINANNVQKISEARAADAPEGASRKFIVLGGLIAGFIAGLGMAIAKGMFDALKTRFSSGLGDFPQIPSPSAPPYGSGAKRRALTVFPAKESTPTTWANTAGMLQTPQPQMAAQSMPPAPPSPIVPQHVEPQITAYAQPQPAPVYLHQQPVMPPFVQMSQPMTQPVMHMPQPMMIPVQHPMFMPQMMQPMLSPQWQHAPVLAPQLPPQTFVMAPQPMQMPIAVQQPVQAPAAVPQHSIPVSRPVPVQQPVTAGSQAVTIQDSLNELRSELLEIARQRKSA
jgi:polysaccharide biosynthesis transport protein